MNFDAMCRAARGETAYLAGIDLARFHFPLGQSAANSTSRCSTLTTPRSIKKQTNRRTRRTYLAERRRC